VSAAPAVVSVLEEVPSGGLIAPGGQGFGGGPAGSFRPDEWLTAIVT
jgi:hypothetical protein